MTDKIIALAYRIVTLLITLCLLVMVVFAWYSSNDNVSTSEIKVSTDTGDIVNLNLTRYKVATSSEGIILGEELNANTDIAPFDLVNSYDRFIYEFNFGVKSTLDISSPLIIKMITNNTIINREFFTKETETETRTYSYLSYVLSYQLLNRNGSIFSLDSNSNAISFELPDTGSTRPGQVQIYNKSINDLELISTSTDYNYYRIYLFVDYNVTNINTIFSANIGSTAQTIYFEDDIRFIMTI